MGARRGAAPAIRGDWAPAGGAPDKPGRCGVRCCKTPLGHSTVRDNIPAWHAAACHCHDEKKAQPDEQA